MRIMAIDYGDAATASRFPTQRGFWRGGLFRPGTNHGWGGPGAPASPFKTRRRCWCWVILKHERQTVGPGRRKRGPGGGPEGGKRPARYLWDERRTTVDATASLQTGNRGKIRKEQVEAVAATLILEGYYYKRMQG
jgi:hypothetical protein